MTSVYNVLRHHTGAIATALGHLYNTTCVSGACMNLQRNFGPIMPHFEINDRSLSCACIEYDMLNALCLFQNIHDVVLITQH
jgi:hypothetical protein